METYYNEEAFHQIEKIEEEIVSRIFEDCLFEDCRFQSVKLVDCRFTGCHFKNCVLSSLNSKNTQTMGNSFEDCRISGVDWASLLDPRKLDMGFLPFDSLEHCQLRDCVFFGMRLKKVDFHGLDLSGCYFDECDLSEADFKGCMLKGTSFQNNNLVQADFRNATDYLFSILNNRTAKAKFSLPEAYNLLSALDIVLDE